MKEVFYLLFFCITINIAFSQSVTEEISIQKVPKPQKTRLAGTKKILWVKQHLYDEGRKAAESKNCISAIKKLYAFKLFNERVLNQSFPRLQFKIDSTILGCESYVESTRSEDRLKLKVQVLPELLPITNPNSDTLLQLPESRSLLQYGMNMYMEESTRIPLRLFKGRTEICYIEPKKAVMASILQSDIIGEKNILDNGDEISITSEYWEFNELPESYNSLKDFNKIKFTATINTSGLIIDVSKQSDKVIKQIDLHYLNELEGLRLKLKDSVDWEKKETTATITVFVGGSLWEY